MRFLLLLFLTFVSVSGFPEKRVKHPRDLGKALQLSHLEGQRKDSVGRPAQRDCKGKCATNIAQKAAAEAKAAQAAQNAAGAQAAHMKLNSNAMLLFKKSPRDTNPISIRVSDIKYDPFSGMYILQVKTQLAEKALQAAKAAEAALAGKQAVVEQLQQEVKEAEAVVAENTAAVHQQQGTVNAAIQAAQQATAQHKLLVQAAQLAGQLERTSHCVLDKTKYGLQEKCHNLSEARARLAHLQHKLQCACSECAATKQAAHCACEAARAACGNARRKKHITNKNTIVTREKRGR